MPFAKALSTRILERRDGLRASVNEATLLRADQGVCLLKTSAPLGLKPKLTSAEPEMNELWKKRVANAELREGRMQIDFLSGALRVRYAEGDEVPQNDTLMLVEQPTPDLSVEFTKSDDEVICRAAKYTLRITLKPLRIELQDTQGNFITTLGGPELNLFNNWDSYQTGMIHADHSTLIGTECFGIFPGQGIYGFGEKFIGLNKAGQTIDLMMNDALGVLSPRTYKNIPFFVTTQGYGVFFNHSCPMTYWAGSLAATHIQVAVQDPFLDYFVFPGSIEQVITRYTALTGQPQVPPAWTFGFWQSKISYKSADEVLEIAREMRKQEVPCDVIHLDTFWFDRDWYCNLEFSKERFPDLKAFYAELKELGFKVSLWQLPYIPEGNELFNELFEVDGFVKDAEGGIYDCGICFTQGFKGVTGVIDYTNPEAVKVHQKWLGRLMEQGASVIKADFGEAAPPDGVYFDGTPGHRMHNLYPLLYNKALFDVTKEVTGGGVIWARSAWAGSQRYPLHWGGDNSPNYENMIPQLAGGLSLGMCGFPFWSQDIGGFLGTTSDRLLIRWMQMGLLLSHSRIHGCGDRELYKFAPETLRICRDFLRLRYRLMPYILAESDNAAARSLPLARPLVIEFEDDPNTWSIQDQFLLGRSLLVAPIFTEGTRRRLYLPAGTWTQWWTKEIFQGNQWIWQEAGIEEIPMFVRGGSILPLDPVRTQIDENTGNIDEVLIAPFETDGATEFTLWGKADAKITYRKKNGENIVQLPAGVKAKVTTLDGSPVRVEG